MSTARRRRRLAFTTLVCVLALGVLHEAGLRVMAEAGVVEQLLSAGGAESLLLVGLALVFVALRLFVIGLGPGLLLVSAIVLVWPRPRSGGER